MNTDFKVEMPQQQQQSVGDSDIENTPPTEEELRDVDHIIARLSDS
ncbi:MAG: hypothetical protein KBD21_05515 [Candidatus Pacebacteria bacterium]|nr:hypothetical protein [Candidatus Paceibacterota bacterium]